VRPAEHGSGRRLAAADVPSIKGLHLSPHGAQAALVNFSSTGLLCECGVRLKVGSPVQVMFEGEFAPASATGRVARCEVVAMAPGGVLRYHIGVEFNSPIALDDIVADPPPKTEVVPEVSGRLSSSRASVPHVIRNRW